MNATDDTPTALPKPPSQPRRWPIQAFRIASLVVPSAIAWHVAFSAPHPSKLDDAVTYALGPLWIVMAGALVARSLDALFRRRAAEGPSVLDRIDVLTASGSTMAWLGAMSVMGSVWLGWASLAVVGLMGLVVLHVAVIWTLLRAGGDDPFRRASLSRRFVPESVVEGDPVIEEVRFAAPRIPAGFRLFARGRVGARWATSRYVVDDDESSGEVVLQRDVGPALRGEHEAEPLEVWLQDVLGLCHSVRVRAGAARLLVLPRQREVEGAEALVGKGGHDHLPRPAKHLPTEGSLRLREYAPGDDARRIHWARSLSAGQIVVRLPDEIPPDTPAVELVLDTFLPGTEALSCTTPADLLDALVSVWLGVGRALLDRGVRVTLVTAAPVTMGPQAAPNPGPAGRATKDGTVAAFRQRLSPRAMAPALRLGARARWQGELPATSLAGEDGDRRGARPGVERIVVSCRLPWPDAPGERCIIVPAGVWARLHQPAPSSAVGRFHHPMGAAENRASRRRQERARRDLARKDHAAFTKLCAYIHEKRLGSFVARPAGRAGIHLEELS